MVGPLVGVGRGDGGARDREFHEHVDEDVVDVDAAVRGVVVVAVGEGGGGVALVPAEVAVEAVSGGRAVDLPPGVHVREGGGGIGVHEGAIVVAAVEGDGDLGGSDGGTVAVDGEEVVVPGGAVVRGIPSLEEVGARPAGGRGGGVHTEPEREEMILHAELDVVDVSVGVFGVAGGETAVADGVVSVRGGVGRHHGEEVVAREGVGHAVDRAVGVVRAGRDLEVGVGGGGNRRTGDDEDGQDKGETIHRASTALSGTESSPASNGEAP